MHVQAALLATVLTAGGALRGCDPAPTDPDPVDPEVGICDATPLDAVDVEYASIAGDRLTLGVSYSGGCGAHDFEVCWDGSWIKTSPMKVGLGVVHDANGDACRELILDELTFDLAPVADETTYAFPGESGVWVLIDAETVWYAF